MSVPAESIVMLCISDYAGQVRGKGVTAADLDRRLQTGIGIAPTNLMINAFGEIGASPWGPRGELIMLPASGTETLVVGNDTVADERFVICDLYDLDGTPWECCPRNWLHRGLEVLEHEFGLTLLASFEHEFTYEASGGRVGDAYLLDSMRLQGRFAEHLLATLRANGITPESFLPEFGPAQYEVTVRPRVGLAAADDAVRVREITRAIARLHGSRACFAPVMEQGAVGNGVHVHFSLRDRSGRPVGHAPAEPDGIHPTAAHFVEGILGAMPSLIALTAPSPVSSERLQPNRWSATFNNLGPSDREAGIRLAPISAIGEVDPADAFNFEYRAADATSSPYLTLGALVWAGIDGLRQQPPLRAFTTEDPDTLPPERRDELGLERLPTSLAEALDRLSGSAMLGTAMGESFRAAYLCHKRSELDLVGDLDPSELIARYVQAY